jgi:hypothetical protein
VAACFLNHAPSCDDADHGFKLAQESEIKEQKSGIAKSHLTLVEKPLPYGCG